MKDRYKHELEEEKKERNRVESERKEEGMR